MSRTLAIWRRVKLAATAAGAWMFTQGVIWAQEAEEAPATPEAGRARDWAISYFLVLFCVGIGVASVCRMARRRERAKPEDYGQ